MRLSFKYKYKKLFWILLGFILACVFIEKVYAGPSSYNFDTAEQERVNIIWNDIGGKTMQQAGFLSTYDGANYTVNTTQILNKNDYPYLSVRTFSAGAGTPVQYYHYYTFIDDVENLTWYSQPSSYRPRYKINGNNTYHVFTVIVDIRNNSIVARYGQWLLNGNYYYDFFTYATTPTATDFLSFDLYKNSNVLIQKSFTYSVLPTYLNGYKKITLSTSDRYYMLSGVSAGSVFIPIDDFNSSGGRLSYYDNDLTSQPYTTYIQDYTTTSDGLYARQDFNLSDYSGADWVMFSKYIYLEGEDGITYDIWVPDTIYDSQVTITPNESGGNSFDFNYKDSNGDIQNEQYNSIDLSQTSPLFNDFFRNFSTNTFGLSSIISSPLSLIESVSSSSCSPLTLPLPFVNGNLTLPCMYSFYQSTFGNLFTLYQTITFGIVSYWVGVRFFQLIKSFKDPDHDEIEVLDL